MFDGDEFNLQVPQEEGENAEVMILLDTRRNLMCEQNRPVGGIVYDAVTGCYLATRSTEKIERVVDANGAIIETFVSEDTMVSHSAFRNYSLFITNTDFSHNDLLLRGHRAGLPFTYEFQEVTHNGKEYEVTLLDPSDVEKTLLIAQLYEGLEKENTPLVGRRAIIKEISGKLMFSAFLPKTFNYSHGVTIVDGILKRGTITKSQVGPSQNAIHQFLQLYYSRETAANFINDVYLVIDRWLAEHGHSVNLRDCVPDNPKYKMMIKEEIEKARLTAMAMQSNSSGQKAEEGNLQEIRKEQNIIIAVDVSKKVATRVMKEATGADNQIKVMVDSGAKGNISQASQLGFGILGQQFMKQWRMPLKLSGGTRFLPTFPRNDPDPAAGGFVDRSFFEGLTPTQFFAHNLSARGGLLGSLETAFTGALQRRMIKSLEDQKVEYDGSVRNHAGLVMEWVANGNGYDPREMHFVQTNERGEILAFIDVKFVLNKIISQRKL